MFKSALAPTISLAIYQSTSVAKSYATVGYLIGIISILSVVPSPRAKFVHTMIANILLSLIGFAINFLAMFTIVKARAGTQGEQSQTRYNYNSTASAISGLWLFAQIYALNVLRAQIPQLAIPAILWAIIANICATYGPQYTKMAEVYAFIKLILSAYFTGFGIATGVSLLIFPTNNRSIVFNGMSRFITSLRGVLKTNISYLQSLESTDMFSEEGAKTTESTMFQERTRELSREHAEIEIGLSFSKQEIAFGKLGADDIQNCFRHLRLIMIPVVGLSSLPDIFERVAEDRGWDRSKDFSKVSIEEIHGVEEKTRVQAIKDWQELLKLLREPLQSITAIIDQGLEHIELTLQLRCVGS